MMSHILNIITFFPLLGVALILVTRGDRNTTARNARAIAMITTVVNLILSLVMWVNFDNSTASFQFVERFDWLGYGIQYHIGVDGISMLFIVLTAGLMPFCILASWESIQDRVPEYMIAFLMLETLMIGVFCVARSGAVLCVLRRRPDSRCSSSSGSGAASGASTPVSSSSSTRCSAPC